MADIFRFTMLSDENDNFLRTYEVKGDMPLTDFHNYICSQLKYDPGHMCSYFTADRLWEKQHEYTLLDMGVSEDGQEVPVLPMEGVVLNQIAARPHDRLIFLFDMFGDRALYLEMTGTEEAQDGVSYPRCVESSEQPPGQLFSPAAAEQEGSVYDEIMKDFEDFEGDDLYDDE